jgi:predicted metal-binding membrane protein
MGGAHGRVVGNLVRASTRRFFGAARDNGPLCIIATGPPPTVSEVRLSVLPGFLRQPSSHCGNGQAIFRRRRHQAAATIANALIFLMWAIMMTGMMVPSATPAILNFAALSREHQRQGRTYVPTAVFVLGYVVVWIAFSIVFTLLQWSLNSLALLSPMTVLTSPVVGGLVLIAAGIYQWSPIHKNLLSRCRNPLGILSRRFGEGATAFFMGLENGAYCLGCCLVLMLILFVAGL